MELSTDQLKTIISAYDFADLVYDGAMRVDPDTFLYFFHRDSEQYILLDTDYLGQEDLDYPCVLDFDYYKDKNISLAVKQSIASKDATLTAGTILFEKY